MRDPEPCHEKPESQNSRSEHISGSMRADSHN